MDHVEQFVVTRFIGSAHKPEFVVVGRGVWRLRPVGTIGISPAIYRWVRGGSNCMSPGGTTEVAGRTISRPYGTHFVKMVILWTQP